MRRFLFSLLVFVFFGCISVASALVYGPWTGAPQTTSITVGWAMEPPLTCEVRYAPLPSFQATGELPFGDPLDRPAGIVREGNRSSQIENLEPDTWYVYKLVLSDGEISPIGTFRTAPEPGEPVTFGIISDTQWQWTAPNRIEMVAEAMAQTLGLSISFCTAGISWKPLFQPLGVSPLYGPHLRWAPLIPVLGNHERDSLAIISILASPRVEAGWGSAGGRCIGVMLS
jgi:Phosphodiesterase/alkaline phosphatase D